jgi:hypothetical protein
VLLHPVIVTRNRIKKKFPQIAVITADIILRKPALYA